MLLCLNVADLMFRQVVPWGGPLLDVVAKYALSWQYRNGLRHQIFETRGDFILRTFIIDILICHHRGLGLTSEEFQVSALFHDKQSAFVINPTHSVSLIDS